MTALATESRVWHEQDIDAVATRMATDPERPLSTAEGERRLRDVGPNELHTLTLGQLAVGAGLALGILVLMEIDKTLRRRSRQRAPQAQRTGRRPCVIPTGATYTARPFVAAGGPHRAVPRRCKRPRGDRVVLLDPDAVSGNRQEASAECLT
jgi:hypothetical protein